VRPSAHLCRLLLHRQQHATDVDVADLMVVLDRLLGGEQAELALGAGVVERDVQSAVGAPTVFSTSATMSSSRPTSVCTNMELPPMSRVRIPRWIRIPLSLLPVSLLSILSLPLLSVLAVFLRQLPRSRVTAPLLVNGSPKGEPRVESLGGKPMGPLAQQVRAPPNCRPASAKGTEP
jgi:hypothetical protein